MPIPILYTIVLVDTVHNVLQRPSCVDMMGGTTRLMGEMCCRVVLHKSIFPLVDAKPQIDGPIVVVRVSSSFGVPDDGASVKVEPEMLPKGRADVGGRNVHLGL
jgi:hypothetical protein